MKVNSRLPDFLQRRPVGRDRRGARRRAADPRARRNVRRSSTFLAALDALHGLRRAGRAARARRAAEGHVLARRGAGQRRGLHASRSRSPTTSSSSTCATTPTRTPGPNNASRDGSMVAAQMVFMNLTDPHALGERRALPAADAAHAPGLGLRREPARRVRHLLRGRDPALRPDLALPRAAPRRPPAGRQLRLDLRHVHRRPASGHRDVTSRSSSRRSAAGARSAARDGNSAIFSGFHGDTFNCPAEVAEARYGLYVDRLRAQRRGRAARASTAAARASCSSTACARTAASSRAPTRATSTRRGPLDGGLEGLAELRRGGPRRRDGRVRTRS